MKVLLTTEIKIKHQGTGVILNGSDSCYRASCIIVCGVIWLGKVCVVDDLVDMIYPVARVVRNGLKRHQTHPLKKYIHESPRRYKNS